MECSTLNRELSAYVDGHGTQFERREVERHLERCEMCSAQLASYEHVRAAMRQLPSRRPTDRLRTALQVIASRESLRRRKRLSWAHAFHEWADRFSLWSNNLMRPLALPVAGGLISTIALFAALIPDLVYEVHPVHNDIETSMFTRATVKDVLSIGAVANEITVDLTVDEQGRMLDYRVVEGAKLLEDDGIRRRLEMNLVMGQFNPATQFGQPVAGKLRVTFRSSSIDVKG